MEPEDDRIDFFDEGNCQSCRFQGYDIESRECKNCKQNYGFSSVSNYQPKLNSITARSR